MEQEWAARFEQAEGTLKRIGTLLAWRELEIRERRETCDTSMQIATSTKDDLKAQVGAFVGAFFTLNEQQVVCSRAVRARQTPHLQELWKRFQSLELRLAKAL